MKRQKGFRTGAGFTLIELLIVIMIIAILAGLIVSAVGFAKRRAAIAKATSMVKTLSQALDLYKSDHGYLPGRDAPSDPLEPDSNVISEVVRAVRPQYAKISEKDLGVIEMEDEPPRPATKEEIDDPDVDLVIIDPWGASRENDSKEKKEDWMHNKDFMDIYSIGPNGKDDTANMVQGKDNDDIGNW